MMMSKSHHFDTDPAYICDALPQCGRYSHLRLGSMDIPAQNTEFLKTAVWACKDKASRLYINDFQI